MEYAKKEQSLSVYVRATLPGLPHKPKKFRSCFSKKSLCGIIIQNKTSFSTKKHEGVLMKKLFMSIALLFLIPQIVISQSLNYSLSFNGENDNVLLPNSVLNNLESFTIEAWIKPKISNTPVVPIYCQGATGFIFFEMQGNLNFFNMTIQFDDGTPNGQWFGVGSNTRLYENRWYHVAATYNKSLGRMSVFLDGKQVGQTQIPTTYYPNALGNGFPTIIGKSPDPNSKSFNGLINSIRISNNERYVSNFIPQLDFQPDQNTLALWNFNEGSGNIAYDLSGNGNHGQIFGATWSSETLPPISAILVRYECNMEIEILGGRFNSSTGYVDLRGYEFGWFPGVRMQKDPTNENVYYYETVQGLHAGDNIPEYKFASSYSFIYLGDYWEEGPNRTYLITQQDFSSGKILIKRMFNDLTYDKITNVPTTILFTINTNGARDAQLNPITVPVRTVHLTGNQYPLSWRGWNAFDNTSDEMIQMYDDGTHGDEISGDGIFSVNVTFPVYSMLEVQYTSCINFNKDGTQPNESLGRYSGDNHIFNLEQNLLSAKASNVYGYMSEVTGITPLTNKIYTVQFEMAQAQTGLTNLLASSTGETQKNVSKALESFNDSQNKKYWIDDSHLSNQGQKVFEDTKKSIEELMKIKGSVAAIQPIIDHIYNADLNIVNTLLKELTDKYNQKGCGNNPTNKDCQKIKKDLDNAIYELAQAKEKYSKGDFDKGVEELKKNWQILRDLDKGKLFKSGSSDTIETLPTEFVLLQNYPNPFNPTTTIRYNIPVSEHVSLKVFDMLGKEIAVLVDEQKQPGYYEVKFNGSKLASGVYFYRLTAGSFSQTKKLLLMK